MNRSKMWHQCWLCAAAVALMGGAAYAATPAYPTVTQARLDNAQQGDGWLMYRGNYTGNGYKPFKQINTSNVKNLKLVWQYKSPNDPEGYESPEIVNGDYMFVTTPKDQLIAFNAATGKKLWEYK